MSFETSYTLGSYRLIAELGHGGMADVFLAAVEGPVGSGFTKLAVVKRLRDHLGEDPEFVRMLMDEARITGRLSHPNVVQLFEMGQDEEHYFLAMEYLDGQPLHRIERRARRDAPDTPREQFYAVISDVLAGLHHAHELTDYDGTPLEIVHRDVTPHNVFVTYDGTVKIVDFGIAKAAGRATETRQGLVKGKFRYMSPEQAMGRSVDRRTDIFAAGVMLYRAATGTRLWADLEDEEVARALAVGTYSASPLAMRPDVPAAIDAICRRALAFNRDDRYATAADMRADIETFLGARSSTLRRELAVTVRTLFENDRANIRTILENARLTGGPSLNILSGAARYESAPMAAAGDSEPPEPTQQAATLLMPGAPPHPVKPPAPPVEPKPARRRRTASRRPFVGGGLLAASLVLVGVAVWARAHAVDGVHDTGRARPVASVEDDPTPLGGDVRTKVEAQGTSADSPSSVVRVRSSGARGGARPAPAPKGAVTAEPSPATSSSAAKKPRSAPLDGTDPWPEKR